MHIKCTNCKKAFEVDEKLIPDNGRLLQCGKCDHQWFYNKENFNETIEKQEVNLNQSFGHEFRSLYFSKGKRLILPRYPWEMHRVGRKQNKIVISQK